MKFKIGLVLGFAAGYWWASTTDEERKARLDDFVGKVRDNPRVRQVTDAAQHRITDTADRTSGAVVDKLKPGAEATEAAARKAG